MLLFLHGTSRRIGVAIIEPDGIEINGFLRIAPNYSTISLQGSAVNTFELILLKLEVANGLVGYPFLVQSVIVDQDSGFSVIRAQVTQVDSFTKQSVFRRPDDSSSQYFM